MTGVKAFLYGMYDVVVFPCWIVLFMCLIRMKKRYAAPLFVWGCSLPVTLYCYVVYILDGGRPWVHWAVVAIDVLAFSQLGWIGALLMTGGYLANNERFKKAALWTCVVSVVSHGLFLVVGLVWHVLSE
ncbi:hypothetical protein [Pseudomonas sp. LH1G9]|uniref:hypothetical protein n=1 Tax=Pseudomonas sp. LH1G9 TaxID=2083055 RepID=UPI000CF33EC0|nr:hypothetical protein [Pseudomonas sp. LH1G9]